MTRARFAAALLLAALAGPALAAGMKLERDRLVNLESPDTVGFLNVRFDFQHNFKDYTLMPIADLTLIFGVWDTVQLEAEAVLHNQETSVFGHKSVFQFNIMEAGVKWAILDQTKEDWFSLAVGGVIGRSDVKFKLFAPELITPSQLRYHLLNRGVYAVATYDLPWVTPYASVRWAEYADSRGGGSALNTGGNGWNYWRETEELYKPGSRIRHVSGVISPGVGLRIKAITTRDTHLHLIGDFQFQSFDSRYSANAWGAGVQYLWKSPHVYSMYVTNTHADSSSESVFGSRSFDPFHKRAQDKFYTFRWSYRF